MLKKLNFSTESETTRPPESCKVLLIGDGCVDEYVYGNCTRLNPEAPVPVMTYVRTESKGGMAWNVYNNLVAFGLNVTIHTNEEVVFKTRYVDEKSNQQILRVDKEVNIVAYDKNDHENYDVIVISDYNKGYLTQHKLFDIVQTAKCPVFIDSKKTELPRYNCIIKVNEGEFKKLNHHHQNVIVTKGSNGAEFAGQLFPSEKVNVHDVVGAGDTFMAALVYFYLLYDRIEEAIPYANRAAGIAVQQPGTYVLTKNDINLLCGH